MISRRQDGYPKGVTNAQEFVQNVMAKLADNEVRASGIIIDRP